MINLSNSVFDRIKKLSDDKYKNDIGWTAGMQKYIFPRMSGVTTFLKNWAAELSKSNKKVLFIAHEQYEDLKIFCVANYIRNEKKPSTKADVEKILNRYGVFDFVFVDTAYYNFPYQKVREIEDSLMKITKNLIWIDTVCHIV